MVWELAICEDFSLRIHGKSRNSDPNITKYNIVSVILTPREFFFGDAMECLAYHSSRRQYYGYSVSGASLDIIVSKELVSGEKIAIKKTFWIRILQKKIKKRLSQRRICIQNRKNPKYINYLKTHGKWPKCCSYFPLFTGGIKQ